MDRGKRNDPKALQHAGSCFQIKRWWEETREQQWALRNHQGNVSVSSVQSLSRVRLFATPWIAACQASLPITNSGAYSNSCPLSWWCHPASHPRLSLSPPAFNLPQNQGLFKWVSSSLRWCKYWSFNFNISPSKDIQDWFPLGWTGWISFQSQASSPAPQFKSISSSALDFLYSPTLTSIHDHWKNHILD